MAIPSLFILCCEAIFVSTTNFQSVCTRLPPKLLHYLLYRAVIVQNASWIQGLVRYWPLETLNFDFDEFNDYTNIKDRSESYIRKDHLWYYSCRFPQKKLQFSVLESIATGLFRRAYQCHQSTSGNKQFIVDLTMVELESEYLRTNTLHPFVRLCHGMPPLPLHGASDCVADFDVVTVTSEKILLVVNTLDFVAAALPCLHTSPCAIQFRCVGLTGDIKTVTTIPLPLENVTSISCDAHSLVEFAKFVPFLQETFPYLDEVGIVGLYCLNVYYRDWRTGKKIFMYNNQVTEPVTDLVTNQRFQFITKHFPRLFKCSHTNSNMAAVNMPAVNTPTAVNMPGIACRRLCITTDVFTRLFSCAYHPFGKLQSLHITHSEHPQSTLEFNNEISKIIIHNCNSLLDLQMSGVPVLTNISLLQETLQRCHVLVVLSIRDVIHKGLHEIFYSIHGLLNLKYLDVTSTFMRGDDLCALHDLLYHAVPKLRDCCLTFCHLDYTFELPAKTEYKPIRKMLDDFMSSQKSKVMHDWLIGIRSNVNFQLLYKRSVSQQLKKLSTAAMIVL